MYNHIRYNFKQTIIKKRTRSSKPTIIYYSYYNFFNVLVLHSIKQSGIYSLINHRTSTKAGKSSFVTRIAQCWKRIGNKWSWKRRDSGLPVVGETCTLLQARVTLSTGHTSFLHPPRYTVCVCVCVCLSVCSSSSSVNDNRPQSWPLLSLLVQAGICSSFHSPPNSDMDYRIFKCNVPMWSFSMHIHTVHSLIERTFVSGVCTEFDSGEISGRA